MRLAQLNATGRTLAAPQHDLVELISPRRGHLYQAIRFRDPGWAPAHLAATITRRERFLRSPSVAGIAELEDHDLKTDTFLYPTGQAWTLAELSALVAERRPFGTRAGLELCRLGAQVIQHATILAEPHGIHAHGALDPWHLVLDAQAEPQLLGYGLPRPRPAEPPDEALRFWPPERVRHEPEDASTDLFSLTLVVLEWMTGEPVYSGRGVRLLAQAERATGDRQLHRWRHELSADVRNVLGRALRRYRDARYPDTEDYLRALTDLVGSPVAYGPSLQELMAEVAKHWKRDPPLDPSLVQTPAKSEPAPRWQAPARREPEARMEQREQEPAPERPRTRAEALSGRRRVSRGSTGVGRMLPTDRNNMFPRHAIAGPSERFLVHVEGEHPRWSRLGLDEPLALSAARLVDELCPTPVGLCGQLTAWFRIVQEDVAWYGDTSSRVLDPRRPVDLERVPNEIVPMVFVIEGREGEERVEAPVGTAVHALFLLSHLQHAHGLRERNWGLFLEDRLLDPWQILDDFEPRPGFELRLRRRSHAAARHR